MTLKSLAPPLALILAVMGTILGGGATPTEVAFLGGFWCPAPNWTVLKESGYATLKTTSMVMMLFIGGKFFSALFYFKGVAPPEFTMMHIYRGIIPFVLLQLFSIALLCLFPSLVT